MRLFCNRGFKVSRYCQGAPFNGGCKTVIFRWLYQFKDYVKHLKDWHDEEGDRDISGKTFLMK